MSIEIAYWNDNEELQVGHFDSVDDVEADVIVYFDGYSGDDLIRLTEWANGLIEQWTIGVNSPYPEGSWGFDGIQGIDEYMNQDRDEGDRLVITPPVTSKTQTDRSDK